MWPLEDPAQNAQGKKIVARQHARPPRNLPPSTVSLATVQPSRAWALMARILLACPLEVFSNRSVLYSFIRAA